MTSIDEALARYPSIELTRLPTPLHDLKVLSERRGPRILIKRDDLTDLTLGGDKPRKLSYEIAYALARGADIVVTTGSAQSNHARLTTAAARKVGLDCAVLLSRDQWEAFQGKLLTVRLMGADVHLIETEEHWGLRDEADALCARLTAEGRTPHFIPVSGTTARSCLGYVAAGLETVDQLVDMGVRIDALYTPSGTGGIFTGMLLGLRARGIGCPVIGISVNRDREQCHADVDRWWDEIGGLLDLAELDRGEYEIHDEFVGAGYGDPNSPTLDAILDVAEAEAVLLDSVYSGKTFAGRLAHIASGRWAATNTLLALHSGGVPALFAYAEPLEAHLRARGRIWASADLEFHPALTWIDSDEAHIDHITRPGRIGRHPGYDGRFPDLQREPATLLRCDDGSEALSDPVGQDHGLSKVDERLLETASVAARFRHRSRQLGQGFRRPTGGRFPAQSASTISLPNRSISRRGGAVTWA